MKTTAVTNDTAKNPEAAMGASSSNQPNVVAGMDIAKTVGVQRKLDLKPAEPRNMTDRDILDMP